MRLPQRIGVYCIIAIIILYANPVIAQLSGKYTLGGTSSSKNFTNWYTFADSLNKLGVSDTLWINVMRDFTDTNPIIFKKHKTNSTNKKRPVIIQGNNHSIQISRWFESILLDSTDNFTFKKLSVINNSSDEPICLRIGPESDFITLDSCNFQINGLTKIPFSNYGAGYTSYYYGSASCYIAITHKIQNNLVHCFHANQARAIRITNCIMETKNTNSPGPGRGIMSRAWPMVEFAGTTNYYFANNKITNFCHAGIDLYYSVDDTIVNNDISKIAASTNSPCVSEIHGISVQSCTSYNSGLLVSNNVIHDIPFKLSSSGAAAGGVYNFRGIDLTNQSNRNNDIFRSYFSNNRVQNIRSNAYFLGFWVYLDANELKGNTIADVSAVNFTGFLIEYSRKSKIIENKISRVTLNSSKPGFFRGFNVRGNNTTKNDSFQVLKNTIDSNTGNGDFYGFYQHTYSASYDSFHINYCGNSITNNGFHTLASSNVFYGYYFSDTAVMNSYFTIIASNLIANNGNASKVFMVYDSTRIKDTLNFMLLQQNTFYHNAPYNQISIYGYKSLVKGNHKLIGNIFDFSSNGNVYPVQISGYQHFVSSKFNTFLCLGKMVQWRVSGNNFSDVASWKGSRFSDTSELNEDPKFINASANNFQTSSNVLQNKVPSISQNLFDLKGFKRSFPVSDIGAIESRSFDLNLVKAVFSRLDSACPGVSIGISVTIKNPYKDSLQIGTIAVKNGSNIQKFRFNKFLRSGDSITQTVTNSFVLTKSGGNDILVYLDNFDDVPQNDTQAMFVWVNNPPSNFSIQPDSSKVFLANKAIYSNDDSEPDTTIINVPVQYRIKPISGGKYTNANYNSMWVVRSWAIDNIAQPVSGLIYTKPTSTNYGNLEFITGDTALEGNTITIILQIKDLISGCDTLFSKKVFIAGVPRLDIQYNDTVCVGDTLKISNFTAGGSGLFQWKWLLFNELGQIADSSTKENPTFLVKNRGLFVIKFILTDVEFGFKYPWLDSVWFGIKPNIKFQSTKACSNQLTQISNQTLPKQARYFWQYSDKSVLIDSTMSDSIFSIKNNRSGSFRLFVKAEDWGCWDSLSKVIAVNQTPDAAFVIDTAICSVNSASFKNTTQWFTESGTYTWYFGELNKISRDTNPTYFYKSIGKKTVQLIAKTDMGCSDTAITQIKINQSPEICDFIYTPDYSFAYYGMKFTPADAAGKAKGNPTELYTWTVNGKDTQQSSAPNYSISMDMTRDGTLGIGMIATTKGTQCSCFINKYVVMDRATVEEGLANPIKPQWIELPSGNILLLFSNSDSINHWNHWAVYSSVGSQMIMSSIYSKSNLEFPTANLVPGIYYIKLWNQLGEFITIPVMKH